MVTAPVPVVEVVVVEVVEAEEVMKPEDTGTPGHQPESATQHCCQLQCRLQK
jgi:hypothetical protein